MVMAKFISIVFLVAIFDATFAHQMVKSDKCVLISTIFWKMKAWAFKKAKNNANLEKYGISKMNLESAILDAILINKMGTRQFTNTFFEDSSPTELKTVHRLTLLFHD